ncbi:MAG: dephospho-CoA kinase [Myxococcales bacterium]|nr:dephospho-CoA kinase [Myxococcales bacterium]
MTRVVGLTGGIASGKSTVSRLLARHGATIVDADQVARDVVASGSSGLSAVLDRFGHDLRLPDGGLDRKKLGALVFADPAALKALEQLLHPLIRTEIDQQISAAVTRGDALVVIDAALLVEMSLHLRCDDVIVVHCGPALQRQRMMARDGMTEVAANQRLAAQATDAERLAVADHAIDNRTGLQELEQQVTTLWTTLTSQEATDDGPEAKP